jgi:hypothetical protein
MAKDLAWEWVEAGETEPEELWEEELEKEGAWDLEMAGACLEME